MIADDIRAATQTHHRHVERHLNVLMSGPTRQQYTTVVKAFFGFFEPWEAAIAASLQANGIVDLWQGRTKIPKLRDDLAYLGITDEQIALLPRCTRLPLVATIAEVMGSIYVMEGSTLGGQYLAKALQGSLGVVEGAGSSYFSGYGKETASRWSDFKAALERDVPPSDASAAVQSAIDTYQAFDGWLEKTLPPIT